MRPQEGRRFPDEPFYFDRGELVVDSSVLPEVHPDVIEFNTNALLATYIDSEGRKQAVDHLGSTWSHKLKPGSQLTNILATNGRVRRTEVDGDWSLSLDGEVTDEYQVQPGDFVVVQKHVEKHYGSYKEVEVHAADQPLPESPEDSQGRTSYEPVGIITEEGKFITWGNDGGVARVAVDLSLASSLAKNRLDLWIIENQLNFTGSLLGKLATSELAKTYLQWLKTEKDTDFIPTKEPGDRRDEFSGKLSSSQLERYRILHR